MSENFSGFHECAVSAAGDVAEGNGIVEIQPGRETNDHHIRVRRAVARDQLGKKNAAVRAIQLVFHSLFQFSRKDDLVKIPFNCGEDEFSLHPRTRELDPQSRISIDREFRVNDAAPIGAERLGHDVFYALLFGPVRVTLADGDQKTSLLIVNFHGGLPSMACSLITVALPFPAVKHAEKRFGCGALYYILASMERMDESRERAWLAELPKTELHVHLEGSIPLAALWAIMEKYGGDPEVPDQDALRERFRFKDFPHFIQTWGWKTQFLRSYDDFTVIGEAVAREFHRQNIVYAEAFFTPLDHEGRGLKAQGLVSAIRRGFQRVPEVEIRLIADLGRDYGPDRGGRLVDELAHIPREDVIGIGLGGSEQKFPPDPFAPVFERARSLGFHTAAHAGEAAGAESVRAAVETLRVERIGHGTRAIEDPRVVDMLAARGVPVECCPISNLRTGVIKRIQDHPIRSYFEKGIPVTVNTDDPAMFGNSIVDDLMALRTRLGFSRADIVTILENGIRCSWAPGARKAGMLAQLQKAAGDSL